MLKNDRVVLQRESELEIEIPICDRCGHKATMHIDGENECMEWGCDCEHFETTVIRTDRSENEKEDVEYDGFCCDGLGITRVSSDINCRTSGFMKTRRSRTRGRNVILKG